jgi:prepilin-type N-terminal cleavage/methylation domain-containing protein
MRSEHGFTVIEMMVVIIVICILLSVGIATYLGARVTAKNRAMAAAASTMFEALTAYQADYPATPGGTNPDPLMSRTRTDDDPAAAGDSSPWVETNWENEDTGLISPAGTKYLTSWPRHPFQDEETITVYRGSTGGQPGDIGVVRLASPPGAFQMTAWGTDKDGSTPKVIMIRTYLAPNTSDCGHVNAPVEICA